MTQEQIDELANDMDKAVRFLAIEVGESVHTAITDIWEKFKTNLKAGYAAAPAYAGVVSEYQLCPKCNGDGNLARYNSPSMVSTDAALICDVCNGAKTLIKPVVFPAAPAYKGDAASCTPDLESRLIKAMQEVNDLQMEIIKLSTPTQPKNENI